MSRPEERSGVTSPPSGTGNVPGLGEAFTINLNTGQGVYSYKLPLPDGRAGHGARVTLEYAHGSGLGAFGLGWRLALRSITRRLDFGVPGAGIAERYLDGGLELVETPGGEFAAAQESAFTRYTRSGDGWRVEERGGVVHDCGMTAAGRIAEPGHPDRVQEWLVERSVDACGNAVEYAYEHEGGVAYPATIRWAAYELRFAYEPRPDVRADARAGFVRAVARRCVRIDLFVDAGRPAEQRVRSWSLGYTEEPHCGVSLLARLTMTSHGSGGDVVRAPVTFGYAPFDPAALRVDFIEPGFGADPPPIDGPDVALVGLEAGPLPGILQVTNGRQVYWPNTGAGRWAPARSVAETPTITSFGTAGVLFADVDGTGTADMLVAGAHPLHGYFENDGDGEWDRFVAYPRGRAAAPPWTSGQVRLFDAEGDGVVDAIASTGRAFTVWRNGGGDGWSAPVSRPRENGDGPAVVDFADPLVHLADMTGDGLADLVRVGSGRVEYWPGLGDGRFGDRVVMLGAPRLPGLTDDPASVALIDVDGDGCADLVRVSAAGVELHLNRNGHALTPAGGLDVIPRPLPGTLRAVNMDGRPGAGLLWCSLRFGRPAYVQLTFAHAAPPYLLTSVDNGSGLQSELIYRAAVEDQLRDAADGSPWTTTLPFPVTVVAGTRERDLVSGQETAIDYRYHDGHFEGTTRQFQGFRRTERLEHGDASRPDTRTTFEFLMAQERVPGNAPEHAGLNGRLARTTVCALDGSADAERPLRVESCAYALELLPTAPGAPLRRALVTVTSHRVEDRERTDDARVEEKTYAYDANGDVIRETLHAFGSADGVAQPDRVRVTEIEYAVAPARHLLGKPARIVERDGAGTILRERRHYYDGPDFTGLPLGVMDRGLMMREEHLVLAADAFAAHYAGMDAGALGYHPGADADGTPSLLADRERRAYDGRGVLVGRRDALGAEERYAHDPDGLFRESLVDGLGATRFSYDRATGQPATITYADGGVARFSYDAQGRVIASVLPGDDPAAPPRTVAYDDTALPAARIARFTTASGTSSAATYFDGHGREFQERIEAGPGRFVVSGRIERNPWGDLRREFEPSDGATLAFGLAAPAGPHRALRYDGRGRIVESTDFDGAVSRAAYRPFAVELTDALGTVRRERFDALRDRTEVVRELGGGALATARYDVDGAGDLVAVHDDSGTLLTCAYDRTGERLAIDHREAGSRRIFCDAAARVVRSVDASGNDVRAEIDPLGRIARLSANGAVVEEYGYDDPARNAVGRLATVSYPGGAQSFRYDLAGRVVQHEHAFDGAARSETLAYEYDALGREVAVTHTDGRRIVRELTPNGWVRAIPGVLDEIAYDARGLPTRLAYANGVVTELDYTPGPGRVAHQRTTGPAGQVLHDVRHERNGLGMITGSDDVTPGGAGLRTFAYDPLLQLREVSANGAATAYSYDRLYNLAGFGDTGAALHYDDAAHPYRLAGVTAPGAAREAVGHDPNGNLASRGARRYRYDHKNALVRFEDGHGVVADYRYDHRGMRVSKAVGDGVRVTRTLFVGEDAEVRDGTATVFVNVGALRVAILAPAGDRFAHPDPLGSTAFFTDAAGAKIAAIAYLPFGNVAASSGDVDARTFGSHPFDAESGLFYMERRHYDPALARFLQPDPVAVARPERVLTDPRALHPYAYAGNDPVNNADPHGLSFWSVVGAIVGVIAAIAITAVAIWVSPILAVVLVIGLVVVGYIVNDAAGGSAVGEFARGFMIGLNAGLNAMLAGAIFGPVVGLAVGIIGFLAAFDSIASDPVYQGVLGWSSWLMPMSWLATGVGVVFFVVNLIAAGVSGNSGIARINSISLDPATGSIVTHGGLLTPVPGGYNLGNFVHINRNSTLSTSLLQHETGHTLNVAAFGAIFHYIGAIDENVIGRGANALAERYADSHDSTRAPFANPSDWWEMWM